VDTSQFKAGNQDNRRGRPYAVNGLFAAGCARHGVPQVLFDIENGEG
jgi:hypothetical protein